MRRKGVGAAFVVAGIGFLLVLGFAYTGLISHPSDLRFTPDPGIRIDNTGIVAPSVDPETGLIYLYYQSQQPLRQLVATATNGLSYCGNAVQVKPSTVPACRLVGCGRDRDDLLERKPQVVDGTCRPLWVTVAQRRAPVMETAFGMFRRHDYLILEGERLANM